MYSRPINPFTRQPDVNHVRRDGDGAMIPADPDNADWRAYEAWLAAGNRPAEPEPPRPNADAT